MTASEMFMDGVFFNLENAMYKMRQKNENLFIEFRKEMSHSIKKINQEQSIHADNQNASKTKQNFESTTYERRNANKSLCGAKKYDQFDKQNYDSNLPEKTDISEIEELPLKLTENDLKMGSRVKNNQNYVFSDDSLQINTVEVRKKYEKFKSPSAGWTVSEAGFDQIKPIDREISPFCIEMQHDSEAMEERINLFDLQRIQSFGAQESDGSD